MGNEADQYRLCCGGLLEADVVDGRVVLRCLKCGTLWFRQADGTLGKEDSGHGISRN